MDYDVIGICLAYEQWYGHGYELRNSQNPYRKKCETWVAWDYGYSEGNRKRLDDELQRNTSLPRLENSGKTSAQV